MGDKEPRRRKKQQRKDSQKKDDVRSEDQFFSTIKSESRDSDQEVEEETVSHGHHHGGEPSSIAKILFVILFSGLVVFISFIFISLHGADRGPVDIFDASHGDHHAEELHDEHLEGSIQDDHDHGHDHHEESEIKLEDFISGMSSLFSFNNEEVQDIESQDIPPEDDDKDDNTDDDAQSYSIAPEIDQGMLEEYIEDTSTYSIEEPSPSEMYPEATISSSIFEAETSYYSQDYSEPEEVTPSTQPEEFESTLEPFTYEEPDDMPTTIDSGIDDDDDDEDEPDSFSIYERADITNDDDYRIRDQLDELDDLVRKDLNNDKDNNVDDDNDDDDEDDDDDDDDEDEGVEEEFDFWQF